MIKVKPNGDIVNGSGYIIGTITCNSLAAFTDIKTHMNIANSAYLAIDTYCRGVENSNTTPAVDYETFLGILIAAEIRKV